MDCAPSKSEKTTKGHPAYLGKDSAAEADTPLIEPVMVRSREIWPQSVQKQAVKATLEHKYLDCRSGGWSEQLWWSDLLFTLDMYAMLAYNDIALVRF